MLFLNTHITLVQKKQITLTLLIPTKIPSQKKMKYPIHLQWFTLYNISINLMHWSFTKKIFENGNQSFNFQFMHQRRGGNLDEITCLEINAANFTIGICVHFHIWAIEHLKLSWCIYGVWYSIKHVLINLIRLYL